MINHFLDQPLATQQASWKAKAIMQLVSTMFSYFRLYHTICLTLQRIQSKLKGHNRVGNDCFFADNFLEPSCSTLQCILSNRIWFGHVIQWHHAINMYWRMDMTITEASILMVSSVVKPKSQSTYHSHEMHNSIRKKEWK